MNGKGGLAPKTVENIHLVLSSGINYALNEGLIIKNPLLTVKLRREGKKEIEVFSREEQQKIIAECPNHYYGMAINYLEKAAQTEPSNAIISDHLGDAYWFGKRKNEARFQWKHALTMKDTTGELDISLVKDKLANGLSKAPELSYNKEIIEEQIKLINKD